MKRSLTILTVVLLILGLTACAASGGGSAQPTTPQTLTAAQAEAIALEHAGFTADQVTALRSRYELDDGIPEYEVEFRQGDDEYDYTVHAETGKVLEWDKDREPKPTAPVAQPTEPPVTEPPVSEKLTAAQAEAIALSHAGFTADQVSRLRTEYDVDDGVPEYSVEFYVDGTEYDYEIHAQTGQILEWDKDR